MWQISIFNSLPSSIISPGKAFNIPSSQEKKWPFEPGLQTIRSTDNKTTHS